MSFYAKYPTGSSAGSNASVGLNGDPVPLSSTLIAGEDGAGDLIPIQVDSNGVVATSVAALPLPTDAATETKQDAQIALETTMDASLSNIDTATASIDGKIANDYGASTGAVRTASQIGNVTGAADFGQGSASAQTLRVAIVDDQDPIAVTGAITATNPSVGPNGDPAPLESTQIGSVDSNGDLIPVSIDDSGNLNVNVISGGGSNPSVSATGAAIPVQATMVGGSDGVDLRALSVDSSGVLTLPVGAATSANQATEIASLSSIDAKLNSLGQKAMAASVPVVIASDQSDLPISASSLPLPTGAATSANQATEIASLASIDGKIANNYGVSTGAVRTASQIGNAAGVADFNTGNSSAQTLRVVLATDQPAISSSQKPQQSTSIAGGNRATNGTVYTCTAGRNFVGCMNITIRTCDNATNIFNVTVGGVTVFDAANFAAIDTVSADTSFAVVLSYANIKINASGTVVLNITAGSPVVNVSVIGSEYTN